MKTFVTFANMILIAVVAYAVFQGIPELVSADSTEKVLVGIGGVLLCSAFIWTRCVEIYNDYKKVKNNE